MLESRFMLVDKFGRKINYARISVTDLCNLRCTYCMPTGGVDKKTHSNILRVEEINAIASALTELGITKIRLTGGEPLVRKGIMDIVEHIGKMEGIKDFAMTTNGILLPKHAKDLAKFGLKRVNISLDSLKSESLKSLCGLGDIESVKDGIESALSAGLSVKINTVLINGFNVNEIEEFCKITIENPIDVRFIELMPIGECANWAEDKFISNNIVLEKMPNLVPEKSDDPSSPATHYRLPNAKGRVGLIRPMSCKFCNNCNRIRITSDGKLKTCLHSDDEIDIRPYVQENESLKTSILSALQTKQKEHNLENRDFIERNMHRIGG